MIEIWKNIEGFASWQVSSFGRIMGARGRILRQFTTVDGYKTVCVGGRHRRVHRLVAAAFIRPAIEGEQVNHINFDKGDNSVENLEWCTPKENVAHAIKGNRFVFGDGSNTPRRFTNEQVIYIREALAGGNVTSETLAAQFSTSRVYIRAIGRRRHYAEVGGPEVEKYSRSGPRTQGRSRVRQSDRPFTRIDDAIIGAIRAERQSGISIRAVATRLGISKSAVYRVISGGHHVAS